MNHDQEKCTRRQFFLKSSAVGAGLALAPHLAIAQEPKAASLTGVAGMPLVEFGKTGEKVSILGLGGSGTVGKAPRLLTVAKQRGVNFIDTAESYDNGNSERKIGDFLEKGGKRDELFLVTKTHDATPAKLEKHLDASLERLRTDYVDALYLHNLGDPNRLDAELKAAAEALKQSKKIRYFGFSCHHANLIPTLEKAAACGFVDVVMLKYNFRDYSDEDLQRVLDGCSKAGLGLVAMKTGAGAMPRFEAFEQEGLSRQVVSLKATWADERIHVIVSKMSNLKQIEENTNAARERQMSQKEWDILERYAQATDHLYCRGCGHLCEPGCDNTVAIADILRYKMYYEGYGDRRLACELFAELPSEARGIAGKDFSASEAACPYGIRIGQLLAEASSQLA